MGGTETTIQQAPTTPAPSAGESAADLYEARLEYDPKIAALEQSLAEQYQPQQAALAANLYQQYAPQMADIQQSLREQYSPTQTALTEAFSQQALQRLLDPYAQTPEETAAFEAIRGRQRQQATEQLRTAANLGGGLFGGRAANREEQAMRELEQQFATEDIVRRQQAAQTALQYSVPVLQQLYPQTTYPAAAQTTSAVSQSAVPSSDVLYQAMYGASQPESFVEQGQASPLWGLAGSALGAAGTAASGGTSLWSGFSSERFKKNIKLWV